MHAGEKLPVVRVDQSIEDLLQTITDKSIGMACIVDSAGGFLGVFTDGDLRRLVRRCPNPMTLSVAEAFHMSRRETSDIKVKRSNVGPDTPVIDCRQIMRDSVITHLVITDDRNRPVGIVRQQDIISVGLG
jgi:arabinose-5-phosphate isomerase